MRRALLGAVPLLFLVPTTVLAASPLEGCLRESNIASAAGKLSQEDWNTVSLANLRAIWPTELTGLNCEHDVCHSVWSMDRVISGHCECCETFAFNIHRIDGTRTEQLDEVVLNYSSSERDQLVATAKRIADAVGMNSPDVADIGNTTDQHVTWIKTRNNYRELSSMELRFSQHAHLWHLFINWGRDRLPPLDKSR